AGDTVDLTCALIGQEKERAVLLNRTTESPSELVVLQDAPGLTELVALPQVCIQRIVPEKLEGRSVVIVATGFCDDVDACASLTAVFGIVESGLNFELLDRVGRRDRN